MPMYDFKDTLTGNLFSLQLSIAKKEDYLKENPHITQVLGAPNLVRGTNYGSKNDAGWKESIARVAEAHPSSPLGERERRRSAKEIKTDQILRKHGIKK